MAVSRGRGLAVASRLWMRCWRRHAAPERRLTASGRRRWTKAHHTTPTVFQFGFNQPSPTAAWGLFGLYAMDDIILARAADGKPPHPCHPRTLQTFQTLDLQHKAAGQPPHRRVAARKTSETLLGPLHRRRRRPGQCFSAAPRRRNTTAPRVSTRRAFAELQASRSRLVSGRLHDEEVSRRGG